MHCESFPPLTAAVPRLLILGSMPGIASLNAGQYYAHPRNAFWPILFDYFGEPHSIDYAVRCRLICSHGLAVWDTAGTCERNGSLDSRMLDIIPNDVGGLLRDFPSICAILCNGKKAHQLLCRFRMMQGQEVFVLPSTSPAHASLSYAQKRDAWFQVLSRFL